MAHFADCATQITSVLIENELVAKDTMRLRVSVPEMACQVVPGQFFMIRVPDCCDPLIGRAFALFDCRVDSMSSSGAENAIIAERSATLDRDNEMSAAGLGVKAVIEKQTATGWIDLVYLVKGKLTSRLAVLLPGQPVELWGPLGNGFSTAPTDHLILVAGGIGQTPFLALGREALGQQIFGKPVARDAGYAKRVSLCYGVRTEAYLACLDSFRSAGVEVHIATEDGSLGKPRRVTALLEELLDKEPQTTIARIVCCGPEPMMAAVSRIAAQRGLPCEVSLETPMACGIGICFTCVAKVGTEQEWDYKRTCVEGPIFDARSIVWT